MVARYFLTGRPGVGKTTAMRTVAAALQDRDVQVAGFLTEEVLSEATRVGFDLVPFHGPRRPMARTGVPSLQKVGRYGVDVAAVDAVSKRAEEEVSALPKGGVVLIDEVGKMELFSQGFCRLVGRVVLGPHPFVVTVTRARIPFARRLLERDDVQVVELDETGRDAVPDRVLAALGV